MKGTAGKEKKKVKFSAEVSKEGQRSTIRCFGALQTAASLGSGNLVRFSFVWVRIRNKQSFKSREKSLWISD
jgi:hypothetical protein